MGKQVVKFISGALAVILSPSAWIQVHPYSRTWDDELVWLLDNGYQIEPISNYHAMIGCYKVWIENHPYGSFELDGVRPRRATILRAGRSVISLNREGSFASDRNLRHAALQSATGSPEDAK